MMRSFKLSVTVLQAFASFMAVFAKEPRHMDALLSCAALHRACGSLHEAADLLKEANAETEGKNHTVTYALATVLTDIGKLHHHAALI